MQTQIFLPSTWSTAKMRVCAHSNADWILGMRCFCQLGFAHKHTLGLAKLMLASPVLDLHLNPIVSGWIYASVTGAQQCFFSDFLPLFSFSSSPTVMVSLLVPDSPHLCSSQILSSLSLVCLGRTHISCDCPPPKEWGGKSLGVPHISMAVRHTVH